MPFNNWFPIFEPLVDHQPVGSIFNTDKLCAAHDFVYRHVVILNMIHEFWKMYYVFDDIRI